MKKKTRKNMKERAKRKERRWRRKGEGDIEIETEGMEGGRKEGEMGRETETPRELLLSFT